MVSEINAAIQSVKVLSDLLRAAHSLSNYNEFVTAIYEVSAKLMAVTSVALASQEKQATLTNRIGELEKEIVELKNWDRERERYQLATVTRGIFAYRVKPGMESDEPPHELCANCFDQGKKSILQCEQPISIGPRFYVCPRCKTSLGNDP